MNQELEDIKLELYTLIKAKFDVETRKLNSLASSILAKRKSKEEESQIRAMILKHGSVINFKRRIDKMYGLLP